MQYSTIQTEQLNCLGDGHIAYGWSSHARVHPGLHVHPGGAREDHSPAGAAREQCSLHPGHIFILSADFF